MENYQLFMIAERQNRIEKNNFKMKKLKQELKKMKPKYEIIAAQLILLVKEYSVLENQLKTLEEDYKKHKEKNVLYSKSNRIQLLSDKIAEREEQIKFNDCLTEWFCNKKSVIAFLSSFKKFYQYKKQIAYEETNENITIFEVIYQYWKQYLILQNNEGLVFDSKNPILELSLKYEFEKRNMLEEVRKLDYELEERRQFLWNYKKNKSILKDELKEKATKIKQMINIRDYVIYNQKLKAYAELDVQNQNYQTQIDNITEISKVKCYEQQRKCA